MKKTHQSKKNGRKAVNRRKTCGKPYDMDMGKENAEFKKRLAEGIDSVKRMILELKPRPGVRPDVETDVKNRCLDSLDSVETDIFNSLDIIM